MSLSARWLVLGALTARLALIGTVYPRIPGAVTLFDSDSYLHSAQALLSAHRFSISPARPSEPQIVRTPGYPALIAAVYAIAGERPWLLAVVASLLAAGTGAIVYRLAAAMSGPTAGTAAVLLYCLEPSTFHYGTLVMTEVPFSFCLALALWFLYRAVENGRGLPAVGCGALLGIATMVRPILIYAILPLAVTLAAVLLRARLGLRRASLSALACASAALLFIAPWQLRNWKATGDASISQIKNVNLYFFDAATVVAGLRHESVRTTQERFGLHEFASRFGFVDEPRPNDAGPPLIVLAHSYRDRARSILLQHPVRAVLDRAGSLWQLLWVPNTISWAYQYRMFHAYGEFTDLWVYPRPYRAMVYLFHSDPWLALMSILFLLPVAAIYVLAWKGLRRPGGGFRILLLVLLAYLLAASTVPGYPDDRLRVPLFPILCVFAGIGFASRYRSITSERVPVSSSGSLKIRPV